VRGGDGLQNRVSILTPRLDISAKIASRNTRVKPKKRGFQNL
jgi:hypothetical protein